VSGNDAFDSAVRDHDAAVRDLGFDIWIGSEPTFTDRWSTLPEWTTQALGNDKMGRAEGLVRAIHRSFPGGAILRTLGRQYPGEDEPRWSFGLYRYRNARPLWRGPPDPLAVDPQALRDANPGEVAETLTRMLASVGHPVGPWSQEGQPAERIALRLGDGERLDWSDPRLLRPSIHGRAIPKSGLCDDLAAEGLWLFLVSTELVAGHAIARIELPAFGNVLTFVSVLAAVEETAGLLELPAVIVAGFPPPVDRGVEWATITPDPAVIEINMAPDGTAAEFLQRNRSIYRSAKAQGLSPFRLYYNGIVADSGGGGQITIGGPSPGSSPFFAEPRLLPRLVRYFNRHPALSFLFAHDSIGSSGQSVRPDERGGDAFRELRLELTLLDRNESLTPEILWRSLGPFLTDPSGNSHRAEINIEKLWNPFIPGRGQLGLVEFRAFRMQHTPERVTGLACLLRAVVAMLMRRDCEGPLLAWGEALHERFALPFYLEQDLCDVFADLDAAGLGLSERIRSVLVRDDSRDLAEVRFEACSVRFRRAAEFWPLVGDASSQEHGTSRLVDSSTQRLELMLRPMAGCEDQFAGWRVRAEGVDLPFQEERDGRGVLKVFGLRYRNFAPWQGLHPTLSASEVLHLILHHADFERAYELGWYDWRPAGGPYPELPQDLENARDRRMERLVTRACRRDHLPPPDVAPPESLTPWSLDLRWLNRR